MSAGIQIHEDVSWLTRNWIFEQLLEDVSVRFPGNEVSGVLTAVSIVGFLSLELYQPEPGPQLGWIIYATAKDILAGGFRSGLNDRPVGKVLVLAFEDALAELVEMFEKDGRYVRPPNSP
jgi:hypothetical protein